MTCGRSEGSRQSRYKVWLLKIIRLNSFTFAGSFPTLQRAEQFVGLKVTRTLHMKECLQVTAGIIEYTIRPLWLRGKFFLSGVTWIGGNVEWKPGWVRTGGGQIWSCCAVLGRLMTEMSTTEMQCDWRRKRVYKEDRTHFDFCAEGKWSLKTCRALIMSLRVGGCPDNSRLLIVVFHYQLWHILFFFF